MGGSQMRRTRAEPCARDADLGAALIAGLRGEVCYDLAATSSIMTMSLPPSARSSETAQRVSPAKGATLGSLNSGPRRCLRTLICCPYA